MDDIVVINAPLLSTHTYEHFSHRVALLNLSILPHYDRRIFSLKKTVMRNAMRQRRVDFRALLKTISDACMVQAYLVNQFHI